MLESVLLGPKAGDWPGLSPVEGMEHLQAICSRKPTQEMCRGNQPVVVIDGKHPVGAESFDLGQMGFGPGFSVVLAERYEGLVAVQGSWAFQISSYS